MSTPAPTVEENCTISFPEMVWMMYTEDGPNKVFLLATLFWTLVSLVAMCRISNTVVLVLHNFLTITIILFSSQIDAYYAYAEAAVMGKNRAYVEALHIRATLFIVVPNLIILLIGGMRLLRLLVRQIWSLNTTAYQVRALGLKKAEKSRDTWSVSQ